MNESKVFSKIKYNIVKLYDFHTLKTNANPKGNIEHTTKLYIFYLFL